MSPEVGESTAADAAALYCTYCHQLHFNSRGKLVIPGEASTRSIKNTHHPPLTSSCLHCL